MTIRVMLIDDHPFIPDTLQNLLHAADDVTVVAPFELGNEALAAILDRQPDVIVLDLRRPVMDGLAVLRAINERRLGVRVVLLTGSGEEAEILEAIRLGVQGVLLEETAPRQLLPCIRTVATGRQWLGRRGTEQNRESRKRKPGDGVTASASLTARELDIVRAIASGLRNKAIAVKLRVTEGTVKAHLHNIYKKLGLDGRLALMIYTKEHGLV